MSRKLVDKLADKFAHEHFEPSKLNKQKERLENFYYDTVNQVKTIISEMSGDLLILKEKEFPLDLRQLLGKIYQQIIDLYKEIDPKDPYPGTLNLINWTNAKQNKAILENLDFLIQHHLEAHEIDFYAKDALKQPSVSSIRKLLELVPQLKQYIIDNPLLSDIYQAELNNTIQSDDGPPSGPEDPTKLH